jgi:hypothetical protein
MLTSSPLTRTLTIHLKPSRPRRLDLPNERIAWGNRISELNNLEQYLSFPAIALASPNFIVEQKARGFLSSQDRNL